MTESAISMPRVADSGSGKELADWASARPPSAGARRSRAVVIGSGFGGLSAAVRLGVRGYDVTVLEQLDQPGGRARVFHQDGFTFDAGPTVVTAPFLFEELWQLCGRRLQDDVELRSLDTFYRLRFHDGATLRYCGDADQMEQEIARFSPGDVAGYRRFMAASEAIYRIGFEQLGDVPFSRVRDMLRVVPDLVRLGGQRTAYGLVAKYIRDPRIRMALSFHPLLVGGNPFTITCIYSLICYLEKRWGVHYAMGGTGRLVQGLCGLIASLGGTVRCNSRVTRIRAEGGRATGVELEDGERIDADVVVSNADVAWTYRNLLGEHRRKRWTDRRLERARYSMGLFVWYFGTDRRYPEVDHHSILFGPRYRELLNDIFRRQRLASDFSLYLHRPTATDPSMAPEGCDCFYVLSPVPHLRSGVDWASQAEPYRRSVEQYLEATVLPELSRHIVTSRLLTPQHFRDELSSVHGAAFSLEPLFRQSAWFRPHNRSEELDGLYLVGAGTHPGAGLPGVLSSARVLDRVVPQPENQA